MGDKVRVRNSEPARSQNMLSGKGCGVAQTTRMLAEAAII